MTTFAWLGWCGAAFVFGMTVGAWLAFRSCEQYLVAARDLGAHAREILRVHATVAEALRAAKRKETIQ